MLRILRLSQDQCLLLMLMATVSARASVTSAKGGEPPVVLTNRLHHLTGGLAFNPAGNVLATAGSDGTVHLWDLEAKTLKQTLNAHKGLVYGVAFSPDGKILATGGDDDIKLWDTSTVKVKTVFSKGARSIAWSPTGDQIVTGGGSTVTVWNPVNGKALYTLDCQPDYIVSVAISSDGKLIAAAGSGQIVKLWDSFSGKLTASLGGHSEGVWSIAISRDGRTLMSAGNDALRFWDLSTRTPKARRDLPQISVAISPDGNNAASAGFGSPVKLWNAATADLVTTFGNNVKGDAYVAFSPDGTIVAAAYTDEGIVRLWKVPQATRAIPLAGHAARSPVSEPPSSDTGRPTLVPQLGATAQIRQLTFTPDGRRLLATDLNNTIQWDVSSGLELPRLPREILTAGRVVFSRDASYALTQDASGIHVWDLAAGTWRTVRLPELRAPTGPVPMSISPDGQEVLIAAGKSIVSAGADSDSVMRPLISHDSSVLAMAVSDDWSTVLTVDKETAVCWSRQSTKEIWRCNPSSSPGTASFCPDGTKVFIAEGPNIVVRDAITGAVTQMLKGSASPVERVLASKDGQIALVMKKDLEITLWNTFSGQALQQQRGGEIAFHSDVPLRAYVSNGEMTSVAVQDMLKDRVIATLGSERMAFFLTSSAVSEGSNRVGIGGWGGASLWDLGKGELTHRFNHPLVVNPRSIDHGFPGKITCVACAARSGELATGGADGRIGVWDTRSGSSTRWVKHSTLVQSVALTPDGKKLLVAGGNENEPVVVDVGTGDVVYRLKGHKAPVGGVAVCTNGKFALTGSVHESILWDLETGNEVRRFDWRGQNGVVAISPDGVHGATAAGSQVILWELASGQTWKVFSGKSLASSVNEDDYRRKKGHSGLINCASFSKDGRWLITGGSDGTAIVWNISTNQVMKRLERGVQVTSAVFLPDSKRILTTSLDGVAVLWDLESATSVCAVIPGDRDNWLVVDDEGRLDAGSLHSLRSFAWAFPDDPFRPLRPETFLRDYYEPRLLPRLLDRREKSRLPPVRPLADLNRVQPAVQILEFKLGDSPDEALVTVEASRAESAFRRAGKEVVMRTGIYDARLFRDGQLVGQWPEPGEEGLDPDPTSKEQMEAWRRANRVDLNGAGKATKSFRVRLPHLSKPGPVEFSAYAFNEDRVKSETARLVYQAPAHPSNQRPRAYLLCMGVSACQSPRWDLRFAHRDAELIANALGAALQGAGHYDVVPVVLTSAYSPEGKLAASSATKDNLKTALQFLAGQKVDPKIQAQLPHSDALRRATPDDLVLVSFSGHGYTDPRGTLYLVPYDVGSAQTDIQAVLPRCLSTLELAGWLREVDAGELTMIVDCCHAGALPGPGFKPGPLGSRGLGQLAYDKGMRVLAASQAADVAVETGGTIQQGLLTFALVRDGLEQRRAAVVENLTLAGLLAYAVQRVPDLYAEVLRGDIKDAKGLKVRDVGGVRPTDPVKSWAQRPELFDYAKKRPEVRLTSRPQGP